MQLADARFSLEFVFRMFVSTYILSRAQLRRPSELLDSLICSGCRTNLFTFEVVLNLFWSAADLPLSVQNAPLSSELMPCNPAGETALQTLIWCFASLSSKGFSSPEGCFFTDTGISGFCSTHIICHLNIPKTQGRLMVSLS